MYYSRIRNLVLNDPKSAIRNDALVLLSSEEPERYNDIYRKALNDSSYSVVATALQALAQTSPKEALKAAELFSNSSVGALQSAYTSHLISDPHVNHVAHFEKHLGKYGTIRYSILSNYLSYLKKADAPFVAQAMPGLAKYYARVKDSDLISAMITKRAVGSIRGKYAGRKEELKPGDESEKELRQIEEVLKAIDESGLTK
jgi:hypothetical protein